ncbi:MAG TPA: ATP synthase F1 subunit gamma [Bacillota bacterium]|nr:ATP synthase F1 subunit gamma [Bacillota bacterium]HUM55651.1 ATP synthase F1 subunit gamma [Bacillota bacterium]
MASSDMQDVKRRIKSVTSMEHITNAMKLVSAAKLRRAKATFEKTNEYFHFITQSIAEVFNNASEVPDKYLTGNREIVNTCYIIVTSCRGLCGSFNSNIIKEAETEMKSDPEKPVIVAIGTKGRDYFAKRDYEIKNQYLAPPESISFLETKQISEPIIEMYNSGEIDEVVLIYTSYVSTLEQRVKNVTLLPFEMEKDPDIMRYGKEVEYEPSVEEVFNYLVPKYVEIMIYGAVVESATCEHAARRMAMENATDNARDMLSDLSLFYNRARQSAITDEIIEIVAGSEAQK